jgi:hypothetical protein
LAYCKYLGLAPYDIRLIFCEYKTCCVNLESHRLACTTITQPNT